MLGGTQVCTVKVCLLMLMVVNVMQVQNIHCGMVAWSLTVEILMDCGNCMFADLNFFSYTLLEVEILWEFYFYHTNCKVKCIFERFKDNFSDKSLIITDI